MRQKIAGVTSTSLEWTRVPLVRVQGGSPAGLVVLKPGSSFIAGTEAWPGWGPCFAFNGINFHSR